MQKLLMAVAVLSISCASATIKTNPASTFPLDVSDSKPAFLFPVNLSHLGAGGDTTAMGLTVTAGVASHFGKTVVSGQQLFDQVGNLSFDLAESIKSQVDKGDWTMAGGSAKQTSDDLSKKMETILGFLSDKGLIEKGYKFKYIIAVHTHGEPGMGGTTISADSWGGVYDVETGQIVSYIESKDTYANKPEAVMGQLPSAYNGIIEKLLSGKAN